MDTSIALSRSPTSTNSQAHRLLFPSLNISSFEPKCTGKTHGSSNQDENRKENCRAAWSECSKKKRTAGAQVSRISNSTSLKPTQTSRRYTFGERRKHRRINLVAIIRVDKSHSRPSCTISIAMLDDIPPGLLPDMPSRRLQHSNVTSFTKLCSAAIDVIQRYTGAPGTTLPQRTLGWVEAGELRLHLIGSRSRLLIGMQGILAMGVFVVGTHSDIDRSIARGILP